MVRGGKVRRMHFSLAQPTASEFTRMLHEAGFQDVQALDENGDTFTAKSRRLLMLAR